MKKTEKRSQAVDMAIKRSFAKLAKAHFERAETSIGSTRDVEALHNKGAIESTERMKVVEDYLERAGAVATQYYFD